MFGCLLFLLFVVVVVVVVVVGADGGGTCDCGGGVVVAVGCRVVGCVDEQPWPSWETPCAFLLIRQFVPIDSINGCLVGKVLIKQTLSGPCVCCNEISEPMSCSCLRKGLGLSVGSKPVCIFSDSNEKLNGFIGCSFVLWSLLLLVV